MEPSLVSVLAPLNVLVPFSDQSPAASLVKVVL
jgi:hypothetical protein